MPGVSHVVAQTLVAELGVDMPRVPTPGHLRSWVGLCPRLDESAGTRRSTRIRHDAPWLKTLLVQAVWTAQLSPLPFWISAREFSSFGREGGGAGERV